jgi:hypothetical protein
VTKVLESAHPTVEALLGCDEIIQEAQGRSASLVAL